MFKLISTILALSTSFAALASPAENRQRIVARDGTAPYTSIQAAIDAVTDATREHPVEILVKPGSYFEMFTTKDWVNVSGTDRDTCIVTYDRKPEEPNHKTHVVWATSNSTLRNLTLIGKDVKYCIHSDGGRDFTLTIENCVLRREPPAGLKGLRAAFGVGLRARQHIAVRNSRLEGDAAIYFHNWDRQNAACSFTVEESILAGGDEAMIVHALGSGQRDFLVLHDTVLKGAKAAVRYVNMERDGPRPRKGRDEIEIFASGNTHRAPEFGARMTDDSSARLSGQERAALPAVSALARELAGPHRAIFSVPAGEERPPSPRVRKLEADFHAWMKEARAASAFDHNSVRISALDGSQPGEAVPFRLDQRWHAGTQRHGEAARLSFVLRDPSVRRIAVEFGANSATPPALTAPIVGDGDFFCLTGNGRTAFSAPAVYPSFVDFDGDGRVDIVGSDRYGAHSRMVWFRNVGTERAPMFSDREVYPLQTHDGRDITNPNRGWLLTTAVCDWDGDGLSDLLVGGFCRYLTFHKNVGSPRQAVFAAGRVIFDAKIFPGLDYGRKADTPYQGVFVEPCDWDGDGILDLLCGSYMRGRIFFLRGTGRDANGLPVLAAPVALAAGGREIDFLTHGKPSVGDWDGDGDLDLISGQYYREETPARATGAFGAYLFENTGSRTRPALAAGVHLRDSRGQLVWTGFHTAVAMVDWNRDGRMDVFASGMQGSALFLNAGAPGKHALVATEVVNLGQAPARVSNFAYPVAHDLDRDGTLDLVVGDGDGFVRFFRGVGDDRFAPAINLKSEGRIIKEVGCPDGGEADLGYVKVAIADWNRDGHDDLIMWTNNGMDGWQRGPLGPESWCLKFFPGTADPMNFGPPSPIKADGKHIMAGYRSKPDVVDLDGDGLLDMIVSCGNGRVNGPGILMFFRNLSGPDAVVGNAAPRLASGVPLQLDDGGDMAVPVRTAVRFADWDGDGDLDLFTGSHSPAGLNYWKNTGTRTKPVFAPGQPVPAVNATLKSHHEIGVDVVAYDGGGQPDLIIGNGDDGKIHLYRRSFLEGGSDPKFGSIEPAGAK